MHVIASLIRCAWLPCLSALIACDCLPHQVRLAAMLERAGRSHVGVPIVAAHVGGGTARCAHARALLRRVLATAAPSCTLCFFESEGKGGGGGDEGGGEGGGGGKGSDGRGGGGVSKGSGAAEDDDDKGDDGGVAFAAARGAAALAAHRLQPRLVEAAWPRTHAHWTWQQCEVSDVLPHPVSVEEASGQRTRLFDAYATLPGASERLTFRATRDELVVRLVEGNALADGVEDGGDDGNGGSTPLLNVIVPPTRRRPPSLLRRLLGGPGPSECSDECTVIVSWTNAGVLEADVLGEGDDDEEDEARRPRLGVCGTLLMLLLVTASVLAAFPTAALHNAPSPPAPERRPERTPSASAAEQGQSNDAGERGGQGTDAAA